MKNDEATKQAKEAMEQVRQMLDQERTCHDDCMCNICIAKQQTWEALEALALLRDEPCSGCGGSRNSNKGNWFCYKCNKKVASQDVIEKCHSKCGTPVLWRASPCSECEGSGEVRKEIAKGITDYVGAKIPCPRGCQSQEPKPDAGEFNMTAFRAICEVAYRDCKISEKQIQNVLNNTGLLGVRVRLMDGALAAKEGLKAAARIEALEARLALFVDEADALDSAFDVKSMYKCFSIFVNQQHSEYLKLQYENTKQKEQIAELKALGKQIATNIPVSALGKYYTKLCKIERDKSAEPKPDKLVESLTDIINKDFNVVCNSHTDGIKADDIIAALHAARARIEAMKQLRDDNVKVIYGLGKVNDAQEARIEQLKKAVEGYQENLDNQYQTIVTQREIMAKLKKEGDQR